jgi:hypothetical protein
LHLNFLLLTRQQRLHLFLRRRSRSRFHFPNHGEIDGDYPPVVSQRNSFFGGNNCGNWSADLRIGTSRLFPANLAESKFGAPGCAHQETQRRAEHEILAAPNSVGQASRLSLTLDEQFRAVDEELQKESEIF